MSFGNCPICGKFCGNILATAKAEQIIKVTGICKIHGEQDLTDQDWDGDDFCFFVMEESKMKRGEDENKKLLL